MDGRPSPAIILVRPQGPHNIGLTARAMANFDLRDLRLVSPCRWRGPKSWAYRVAKGGRGILDEAREFPTLEEAVADLRFLVGTTRRHRTIRRPRVDIGRLRAQIPWEGGPVGSLFGAEDAGLTAEEISRCQAVLEIPAGALNSLNLSHAVAIVGFALRWAGTEAERENAPTRDEAGAAPGRAIRPGTTSRPLRPATQGEIARLVEAWIHGLRAIRYFRKKSPDDFVPVLRDLFLRIGPTSGDADFLTGIAAQMAYFARKTTRGETDTP